MKSSLESYLKIMRLAGARRLLASSLPARLAYGMISLSIYFKVQRETNSIAVAGLAVGFNALTGALTAGPRGAIIDRYGLIWPLRLLVPGYALLVLILSTMDGKNSLLVLAFLLGLSAPPINLAVRPLWKLTLPQEQLRTGFALDTATLNAVGVIAPLIATSISLQLSPSLALQVCSSLMFIGGLLLLATPQVKTWRPEVADEKAPRLWRVKGIQLLALEGIAIGLGWGAFDIGVPAFGTLEKVPERVGIIFSIMSAFNVLGGLLAGTVSRKVSPLRAFRVNYFFWALVSLPLAFTDLNWSMAVVTAALALFGGTQQVFYWEITEAIRPKGASVQTIAWLWTIEGGAMALGTSFGGYLAELFSPRYCLALTTIALCIGCAIINLGKNSLKNADVILTEESEIAAFEDNVDQTR